MANFALNTPVLHGQKVPSSELLPRFHKVRNTYVSAETSRRLQTRMQSIASSITGTDKGMVRLFLAVATVANVAYSVL